MKLLCRFLLFLCQEMYACIKMFLRPPLTQRYWTPTNGTPTDHTGSLGHRKNHLDEVQAGSGAVTHQEIDACSNCQIVK